MMAAAAPPPVNSNAQIGIGISGGGSLGLPGIGLGLSIGTGYQGTSQVAQANGPGSLFQNIAQPNDKIALYALAITNPNDNSVVYSVTFPLSPSAIQKDFTAMSAVYDVGGSSKSLGVTRKIDLYGNSPVTFRIEGTTGWQRHSTDGFAFTGMEAIAGLQNLLNQFAFLNAQQQENNDPNLYQLEFYDYFSNTFWQVVPIGTQGIRQNQSRPLVFDYSFVLVGVAPVSDPPPPETFDPLLDAFDISGSLAIGNLNISLTGALNSYSGNTAGSLGIAI